MLTCQVVPGKVMAADVVKLTEAPTVQGARARVKVFDGKVMIGGTTVIKTEIETSDGAIHIIDTVILPPNGSAKPSCRAARWCRSGSRTGGRAWRA